jgi:serine/threonine protein kinase
VRRESIIGQMVADRFKVLSLLGEGGTGQVYLAEHNVLERKFAIKVLRRDMVADKTASERFRREARAASRMQHRNIVYISDFGQLKDGRPFLVMEYIPGEELNAVIAREQRLTAERAARILVQISEALDYAHDQGVVHRDLKSENIILTNERHRVDVAKVLDFGLAKILYGSDNLDTITFKGQIFGTPEYIPPEQIVGDEVDQRADIYSMGVLAFEMVTGRTPFTGTLMELLVAHRKLTPPLPSAVCPREGIPECFDHLVRKAMQKRPEDRFGRASDIADLLRTFLRGLRGGRGRDFDSDLDLIATPVREAASVQMGHFEAEDRAHPDDQVPRLIKTPSGPTLVTGYDVLAEEVILGPGTGDEAEQTERHEVRKQLRRLLQKIARTLRDNDLASEEFGAELERNQRLGEQAVEVENELVLLASRVEDVENAGREQESQLRYAIIDLGMERGRLEEGNPLSPGDQAMIADLAYQIAELEVRLLDVARRRETRLDEVDHHIVTQRRELDNLRAKLARQDKTLLRHVEQQRVTTADLPEIAPSYELLEELKSVLEQ